VWSEGEGEDEALLPVVFQLIFFYVSSMYRAVVSNACVSGCLRLAAAAGRAADGGDGRLLMLCAMHLALAPIRLEL